MGLFTNLGVRYLWEMSTGQRVYNNLVVRLFTNNFGFDFVTTTADLDECTLPGYAGITLVPASWGEGEASGLETSNYPTLTFTIGPNPGATTIYGYFVTDQATGRTIWGDNNSQPFAVPSGGAAVTVNLTGLVQSVPV